MGTRGAWAKDFLHALGNSNPSNKTINFVSAWTKAEDTDAKFNPLATTLAHGNYTKFNYANVKNYSSRQEGIEASVMTLAGNFEGYKGLREGLINNNPDSALTSGGLDTWGSGSLHVGNNWLRDTRDEPLKSESGSADTSTPKPSQNAPAAGMGQNPTPYKPPAEGINHIGPHGGGPDVPIEEGSGVTASGIQKAVKIGFGITLAIAGTVLVFISVAKSDSAKAAVNVAKVAAL